jgi:hypothetical protein
VPRCQSTPARRGSESKVNPKPVLGCVFNQGQEEAPQSTLIEVSINFNSRGSINLKLRSPSFNLSLVRGLFGFEFELARVPLLTLTRNPPQKRVQNPTITLDNLRKEKRTRLVHSIKDPPSPTKTYPKTRMLGRKLTALQSYSPKRKKERKKEGKKPQPLKHKKNSKICNTDR